MKNLILDVDGVMVDLITPLLERYNKIYDTDFKYSDIKDYNLRNTLQYFNQVFLDDYDLYFNLKFLDDRIPEILLELKEKYNIYIVTSLPLRCSKAVAGRLAFFEENLLIQSSNFENLIFSQYKNIITKHSFQTVIVDDCIETLEKSVLVLDKQIVFNQPWNQEEKMFTRVNNWKELYQELMEY